MSDLVQRERETVLAMIDMRCAADHVQPCARCDDLRAYVTARLARCPLLPEKPTCLDCTVHCYAPARREEIRAVMRHAGPRMIWRHPLMALRHMLRSRPRRGA